MNAQQRAKALLRTDVVEVSVPPNREPQALTLARMLYAERRRRDRTFPADIFGEPSWDILLDLFVARGEGRRVPTTSACIGAHVPPTTALRWLRLLEGQGLIEREEDERDGRRTFVRLSTKGMDLVGNFLDASRLCGLLSAPNTNMAAFQAH
ncbi:winged helix DNA-binding protein [Novosphingobium sp.]|uniref:winged helix DNA-binding protein n=1 Tax=Novosphingobium sp. TaxID=1874826 RepID=UPI0025CDCBC1|nr:winged helix DNA-binding protein [Novosphingobium sp.]